MDYISFEDIYIMAAIEAVYGVAPAMTPAANTIQALNLATQNLADKSTRARFKNYRGATKFARKNKRRPMTFQTDAVGAILGGSAVGPNDTLLRACGLTRSTLSAPAGLRYAPTVGGADSSVAFEWYKRNPNNLAQMLKFVTTGHRGTFTFNAPYDEKATFDWDFEGNYCKPTPVTAPTPDFSMWQDAEDVTDVTTELTVNGNAIEGVSYQTALGYVRKTRKSFVKESRGLQSRENTGQFSQFDMGITPLDFYDLADSEGLVTVELNVVSASAGKTLKLTQVVQLEEPEEANQDGDRINVIKFVGIAGNSGNADFMMDIF